MGGLSRDVAEFLGHLDDHAPARLAVEQLAARNGLMGHLLQAQSLGAKLDAVAVVLLGPSTLVLDGQGRFARLLLDDVGDAAEPQFEAAQGQGPNRPWFGPWSWTSRRGPSCEGCSPRR